MSTITRLRSSAPDFESTLKKLLAFDAEQDDAIEAATARILQRVRHEGDAALLELTNQFDQVNAPNVAALEIPAEEWKQALTVLPAAQR
nr:histidinol dehydrogenase [Burkholderiaceae bacterium]